MKIFSLLHLNKKRRKKVLWLAMIISLVALVSIPLHQEIRYVIVKGKEYVFHDNQRARVTLLSTVELIEKNYGSDIDRLANDFGLPPEYFKALIAIECAGEKPAPSRYEKHVHRKLQHVQEGSRRNYEALTPTTISDASDAALVNLATSWGAFQIMGYKCVELDIFVNDIRGNNGLYWGMKWINEEYGHLLKAGRFKDAFHFHNTGQMYPRVGPSKTYHPNYVNQGLRYLNLFQ